MKFLNFLTLIPILLISASPLISISTSSTQSNEQEKTVSTNEAPQQTINYEWKPGDPFTRTTQTIAYQACMSISLGVVGDYNFSASLREWDNSNLQPWDEYVNKDNDWSSSATWCGDVTFHNLTPETTYEPISFKKYNGGNYAEYVKEKSQGDPIWTTYSAISNINITQVNNNSVKIDFTYSYENSNVNNFYQRKVSYSVDGGNTWLTLSTNTPSGNNSYVLTNLTPKNGTYQILFSSLDNPSLSDAPIKYSFTTSNISNYMSLNIESITPYLTTFKIFQNGAIPNNRIYYQVSSTSAYSQTTFTPTGIWTTSQIESISFQTTPNTTYYLSFAIQNNFTSENLDVLYLNQSGFTSSVEAYKSGQVIFEYQFTTPGINSSYVPVASPFDSTTNTVSYSFWYNLNDITEDQIPTFYIRYQTKNYDGTFSDWVYYDADTNLTSSTTIESNIKNNGINSFSITPPTLNEMVVQISTKSDFSEEGISTFTINSTFQTNPLLNISSPNSSFETATLYSTWDRTMMISEIVNWNVYKKNSNEIVNSGTIDVSQDSTINFTVDDLQPYSEYTIEFLDAQSGLIYLPKDQFFFSTTAPISNISKPLQIDQTTAMISYDYELNSQTEKYTLLYSINDGEWITFEPTFNGTNILIIPNLISNITNTISIAIDSDGNYSTAESSIFKQSITMNSSITDIEFISIQDSKATLSIEAISNQIPVYLKIVESESDLTSNEEYAQTNTGIVLDGKTSIGSTQNSYILDIVNLKPEHTYNIYVSSIPMNAPEDEIKWFESFTTTTSIKSITSTSYSSSTYSFDVEIMNQDSPIYIKVIDEFGNVQDGFDGMINLNQSKLINSFKVGNLSPSKKYTLMVSSLPINNLNQSEGELFTSNFTTSSFLIKEIKFSSSPTTASMNVSTVNPLDSLYIKVTDGWGNPINTNTGIKLDGLTNQNPTYSKTNFSFSLINLTPNTTYFVEISSAPINYNLNNNQKYKTSFTTKSTIYNSSGSNVINGVYDKVNNELTFEFYFQSNLLTSPAIFVQSDENFDMQISVKPKNSSFDSKQNTPTSNFSTNTWINIENYLYSDTVNTLTIHNFIPTANTNVKIYENIYDENSEIKVDYSGDGQADDFNAYYNSSNFTTTYHFNYGLMWTVIILSLILALLIGLLIYFRIIKPKKNIIDIQKPKIKNIISYGNEFDENIASVNIDWTNKKNSDNKNIKSKKK